jgi:predicted alpha/beta hydrolase
MNELTIAPNATIAPAQAFTLKALDGYVLAATHYPAAGARFIVIASATGVPRGFYRRFAEYAQSRGFNVISADYRGIGDSKHGDSKTALKGMQMEYADWSRYDLAAAVAYAKARGDVWLVGHSLGGHAIGQLPEPNLIRAAYVCGSGAGWHGWMPRPERYKVWLTWHVIGPISTRILGYLPMKLLGAGEDLPIGVYRDWKRWCGMPHYFFDDPEARAQAIAARFAQVTLPIAAAVSIDDLWAPPASRDAFFKGFRASAVTPVDLLPAAYGGQIGHMGYFRPKVGEVLWPQIIDWLQQH